MIQIFVNERPFSADLTVVKSLGELVELVKASIDPDTIITSLMLNGQPPSDTDWRVPLALHDGKKFEVTTGSRKEYLNDRLAAASLYLDQIMAKFKDTSRLFREGNVTEGNSSLRAAVTDLQAFVQWYGTLLQLGSTLAAEPVTRFKESVTVLTGVCEQLLQQQLYRAWWALAETIEQKLEPQLDQLKSRCLAVYSSVQP